VKKEKYTAKKRLLNWLLLLFVTVDRCVFVLQPEFQGMLPVEEGEFTTLQRSAFRWPDRLKQAAAVCNALSLVSRKQAVGDVCEREVFKAVEAQFLVSRAVPFLAPLGNCYYPL